MSKEIEAGEVVEITAMDSKGVWGSKEDRKKFLGMKIKLKIYRDSDAKEGWKYIEFIAHDVNHKHHICMLAKIRRIKP